MLRQPADGARESGVGGGDVARPRQRAVVAGRSGTADGVVLVGTGDGVGVRSPDLAVAEAPSAAPSTRAGPNS